MRNFGFDGLLSVAIHVSAYLCMLAIEIFFVQFSLTARYSDVIATSCINAESIVVTSAM